MSSDNNKSTTAAGDKPKHQLSFKEQLDKAAFEAKNPDANKPQPSIVDKVTETVTSYIPPLAKVIGKSSSPADDENKNKSTVDPGIPPVRPDHDAHIEQFIQDQHRSKTADSGKVVT